MPLVFKTKEDSADAVNIGGVGVLGAYGRGGIPVADAAQVMQELQEKDADGVTVLDEDGNPKPLTGAALTAAAKAYAEQVGLTTENVPEGRLADLPREMGTPPDRPDARDLAREEYERMYAGLEPVNDEPEARAQLEGRPEAGAPQAQPSTGGADNPDTRKED